MVEFFSGFSRHVEKRSENYGGNVGKPTEEMNNGIKVYTLRENQTEIFNDHRDCSRLLITMPPGSGKSTAVVACMRWKIENDPDHKIIVVVPQTQISKTFKQAIIRYPDGNELVWAIDNDLCNSTVTQKVSQIVKFLSNKKSNQNPHSRVLITTHMALAHAHTKIKDFSVYENVTIAVDESHHIMYNEKTNNKIGQLVKDINGNDECSLWFVTATPYRGDQASIIPEEQLKKFEKYTLPLDEHWDKNINYISGFEFNFVIYKENEVFEGVKEVLKLGKRKTIIFCPYVGKLVKDSDKNKFKRTLIGHIKKIWPDANIMDLIDTHNRVEKKKILNNDADAKEIDIILTLKIFDEGSDWVPAEQCIDLAPINSLTKQYQRFGRPWRDHFDKNIVSYYSFIPEIEDYDKEELRDHLTQSYNTFVGSLILQESINPVPFPKNRNKNNIKNPFEESVPNENNRRQILEEVTKNLLFLRNLNENPDSNEIKKSIHEALDKYEIPDENEEVSTHIVKMLRSNKDNKKIKQKKPKWVNKSIDLSWMKDAGFDHIWNNEIFDHLLSFGTSVCGIKHFSQFRKIYNNFKTLIEHRQDALKLIEKFNGLPNRSWMNKNGWTGLSGAILRRPEYFSDLPKLDSKILIECRQDALDLIERFNIVPSHSWLKKNGRKKLSRTIYRRPEYFSDLPQLRLKKTLEEHRQDAIWLFKKFNIVPSQTWMNKNGYGNLYVAIKTHPKYFEDLPKLSLKKTLEDHQQDALWLIKKFGNLPTHNWMKRNKLSGLSHAIRINPTFFKDILNATQD